MTAPSDITRPPTLAELRTAAIESLFAAGLAVHASRVENLGSREDTRRAGERAAHLADDTGLAIYAVAYAAVLRLATAELHGSELERAVTKDREGKARRGWIPGETPGASSALTAGATKNPGNSSGLGNPATKPRQLVASLLPTPSKAL